MILAMASKLILLIALFASLMPATAFGEAINAANTANATPWTFPQPALQATPEKLERIVIDPGHGGNNEGAIGAAEMFEKYLTLQVALALSDRLSSAFPDATIILTRTRDEEISLTERISRANKLNADLFISLHFNSSNNPDAFGFESFWTGDFWEKDLLRDGVEITSEMRVQREKNAALGYRMACAFNAAMQKRFDVPDRGVKPGNYTVLTRAEIPAVVLELAFLTHATEGINLTTYAHQAKYVDALVEALIRYADISVSTDAIRGVLTNKDMEHGKHN